MENEIGRGLEYILEELQSVNEIEESEDEIVDWHDSDKILTPLEKPKTKSELNYCETLTKRISFDDEEEFSLSQIECPNNSNLNYNKGTLCRIIPESISTIASSEIESINTGTISNLQITNDLQNVASKKPEPSKDDGQRNHLLINNSTSKTSLQTQPKRRRGRSSGIKKTAKLNHGKIPEKKVKPSANSIPLVVLHDLKDETHKAVEKKKDNSLKEWLNKSVKCSYSLGAVVWAKVPGYSFWPAMVDDDPDINMYYWTTDTSLIPTHYHVVFFDTKDRLSRSWVKPNNLKPFVEIIKVNNKKPSAYFDRFKESIKTAKQAAAMDVQERLSKYSFKARMNSPGIKLCQD